MFIIYKILTGKEIDFYIPKEKILIEVSLERDEEHVKKLSESMNELKVKESVIITWDYEGEEEFKGKKIRFVPLWKWLLNF